MVFRPKELWADRAGGGLFLRIPRRHLDPDSRAFWQEVVPVKWFPGLYRNRCEGFVDWTVMFVRIQSRT